MSVASQPALRIDNLRVSYLQNGRRAAIINGFSLKVGGGEFISLLGESGSGKTTIAKALLGLLPPSASIDSGVMQVVNFREVDLTSKRIQWPAIRGRLLSMVFQDARQALNPVITIGDHFKETILFHKIASRKEARTIAGSMLSLLGFLDTDSVLNAYSFELSGGMCQRVCIALALCLKPAVLIADEPTSALDTVSQKEVLQLLKTAQKELRQTVLFITHDIALANAVSDKVVVLRDGVVVDCGAPKEVFSSPRSEYTQQLIDARSLVSAPPPGVANMSDKHVLLDIKDLAKGFRRDRDVLRNLSVSLREGEILGILGQSGCGKSTLSRCIVDLEKPDRGCIMCCGINVGALNGTRKQELCRHVQMIFQDARASLNPRFSALRLVQEPLDYLVIYDKSMRKALAKAYLEKVGIERDAQNRRPPQLSTGECQRVAIARALVLRPKILICDEAVSALDMSTQAQILTLIKQLQAEMGFSVLMISHDIRVLRSFCHRIAIMKDGRFCEIREGGKAFNYSCSPYTQLLLQCELHMEGRGIRETGMLG